MLKVAGGILIAMFVVFVILPAMCVGTALVASKGKPSCTNLILEACELSPRADMDLCLQARAVECTQAPNLFKEKVAKWRAARRDLYRVTVKVPTARIRWGPSTSKKIVGVVSKGERLEIQVRDRDAGWTSIRTDKGVTGWVRDDLLLFYGDE